MVCKIVDGVSITLSDEEFLVISSQRLPAEFVEKEVRQKRNRLLAETDWMALSDNTMTPEWASYRQALRDITGQAGFPYSIVWPIKPE